MWTEMPLISYLWLREAQNRWCLQQLFAFRWHQMEDTHLYHYNQTSVHENMTNERICLCEIYYNSNTVAVFYHHLLNIIRCQELEKTWLQEASPYMWSNCLMNECVVLVVCAGVSLCGYHLHKWVMQSNGQMVGLHLRISVFTRPCAFIHFNVNGL